MYGNVKAETRRPLFMQALWTWWKPKISKSEFHPNPLSSLQACEMVASHWLQFTGEKNSPKARVGIGNSQFAPRTPAQTAACLKA